MNHEFCPDCGHLLSKVTTWCAYCGWSDRVDDFAGQGFDPDTENDLVYTLADGAYFDQRLRH